MSRVLITGIAGQTGSYLAEHHLSLGNEVYGIIRRHSVAEEQTSRLKDIFDKIDLRYGDLLDMVSIEDAIRDIQPDEIYNLAAQSHVRVSSDVPIYTVQTNSIGVLNILEAYRRFCPSAKFYQASSSEIFGLSVDEDGFQRESTPPNPVSVYGVSKAFGYHMVRHYRRAFGLHACNGILFNHESPRRATSFVTQKIVKGACNIAKELQDTLELGNLEAFRDWGHAKDYAKAMVLITNHIKPMDFVVASGETHTVREVCEYVFHRLGMDYRNYVKQNPKFLRTEELPFLKGDSTKARTILNWKPEYTFETLLDAMIAHEMETY